MIVDDKLQVTVRRGEIKSLTFDRKPSTPSLQVEDTAGLFKSVPVRVEGLEPGEYLVQTENSELRVQGYESLEFEVSGEHAKSLHISRAEVK